MTYNRPSIYIAMFVAFLDNMGVGLIYPLFAAMLFDSSLELLPLETTPDKRGLWLGILIALMPFAQFFGAPLWGVLSDNTGRKTPLLLSIVISLLGYATALCGVIFTNIWLLLASRIIIGFASGNISIVQATIADFSSREEKVKNFGLYSMALGAGFTLGPFFGGSLSTFGYAIPFLFAFLLTFVNFLFALLFFKETQGTAFKRTFNWMAGIESLKKAFGYEGLRIILLCSFLHNFGWSYFFEFTPVYLISQFQFTPLMLGLFYAAAGCFYALSTGILIRPLSKRLRPETLFFGGNLLAALAVLTMPFLTVSFIWPILFIICYFAAFVSPSSTTLVSNSADLEEQGEALGILSSVNAAALVLSPLFSGSLVGINPSFPMKIGGLTLLLAAFIMASAFGKSLFKNPKLRLVTWKNNSIQSQVVQDQVKPH